MSRRRERNDHVVEGNDEDRAERTDSGTMTGAQMAAFLQAFAETQAESNRLLVQSLLAAQVVNAAASPSPAPSSSVTTGATPGNFSRCTARFSGASRDSEVLEAFIDSIEIYKECTNVSDEHALRGLPMLLEGEAAVWFRGIKGLVTSWSDALQRLRAMFGVPRPPHKIFRDIFAAEQNDERTEVFVGRLRVLVSKLPYAIHERMEVDMIYGLLSTRVRKRLTRESINNLDELIERARAIEDALQESSSSLDGCTENVHVPSTVQKTCNSHVATQATPPAIILRRAPAGARLPGNAARAPHPPVVAPASPPHTPRAADSQVPDMTKDNSEKRTFCYYCKRSGHFKEQCIKLKEKADPAPIACYGCGEKGVIRAHCGNCSRKDSFFACDVNTCRRSNNNNCRPSKSPVSPKVKTLTAKGSYPRRTVGGQISSSVAAEDLSQAAGAGAHTRTYWSCMERGRNGHVAYDHDQCTPGTCPRSACADVLSSVVCVCANALSPTEREDPNSEYSNVSFSACGDNGHQKCLQCHSGKRRDCKVPISSDKLSRACNAMCDLGSSQLVTKDNDKNNCNRMCRNTTSLSEELVSPTFVSAGKCVKTGSEAFPSETGGIPFASSGVLNHCHKYKDHRSYCSTSEHSTDISVNCKELNSTCMLMSDGTNELPSCNASELRSPHTRPILDIEIGGFSGTALVDTAARRSIAGFTLYALLQKLRCPFRTTSMSIKLADGSVQDMNVKLADVEVKLRNSVIPITFVIFPNAVNNETLLGIDFIVKAKLVINFSTMKWIVADRPREIYTLRCEEHRTPIGCASANVLREDDGQMLEGEARKPAKVANPLTDLTRKDRPWKWEQVQEPAFQDLKRLLSTSPILSQPDYTKPFIIRTDASNYALGAVLLQGETPQTEHPIEYASRLLIPAERNYSTTEREALAVVWTLDTFRGYVDGHPVRLASDHQPLKWLLKVTEWSTRSVDNEAGSV